ncbi:MAG: SLC13 family permease [Planctomycetota bacterium]
MDWGQVYVIALAALATGLLAAEKAHLSVVGVGLLLGVIAPGLVSPAEAVAGFGNKALVTVGALFVLGEGFQRTGAAAVLSRWILRLTRSREAAVVLALMVSTAALSAFVNNTLVVLTFMPVVTSVCRATGMYPSRLLIPLSYASIAGGLTTVVGTSTNLIVSGVLEELGRPAIGMFEITGPGLALTATCIGYMTLAGRHLLPRIASLATQPGAAELREYVTEITIGPRSPLVGVPLREIGRDGDKRTAQVGMVVRDEDVLRPPFDDTRARAGDIVVVSGHVQDLARLHRDPAHAAQDGTEEYDPGSMSFFELALSPSSSAVGECVRDLQLKARHGAVVVGLQRAGRHLQSRFADLRLLSGDVLLAFGNPQSRQSLRRSTDFNLIEGVEERLLRREKAPIALGIGILVVLMFAIGIDPATVALFGALATVVSGCVTVEQANRSIGWPVLTFIAGTLALSKALRNTHADVMLGEHLAGLVAGTGVLGLMIVLWFGTTLLTEFLSNNAVAAMMTPVAVATAAAAKVDERMLVMVVLFAASCSFANPLGYKTNLLVFGPGGYRFRDFLRVGLGLDVLMGIVGLTTVALFCRS